MDATLAEIVGSAMILVSAASATAALYGRSRRGAGRIAIALVWLSLGAAGITILTGNLAPGIRSIPVVGVTVIGALLVTATVLATLRARELAAARRRDTALGLPPILRVPSCALIVSATGLVALLVSAVLIAPWMLVAAAVAGMQPTAIVHGYVADVSVATSLVWFTLTPAALAFFGHRAGRAELLRRGIELRVADAELAANREGFAAGREDGYRHAAFGTTWD